MNEEKQIPVSAKKNGQPNVGKKRNLKTAEDYVILTHLIRFLMIMMVNRRLPKLSQYLVCGDVESNGDI